MGTEKSGSDKGGNRGSRGAAPHKHTHQKTHESRQHTRRAASFTAFLSRLSCIHGAFGAFICRDRWLCRCAGVPWVSMSAGTHKDGERRINGPKSCRSVRMVYCNFAKFAIYSQSAGVVIVDSCFLFLLRNRNFRTLQGFIEKFAPCTLLHLCLIPRALQCRPHFSLYPSSSRFPSLVCFTS